MCAKKEFNKSFHFILFVPSRKFGLLQFFTESVLLELQICIAVKIKTNEQFLLMY